MDVKPKVFSYRYQVRYTSLPFHVLLEFLKLLLQSQESQGLVDFCYQSNLLRIFCLTRCLWQLRST